MKNKNKLHKCKEGKQTKVVLDQMKKVESKGRVTASAAVCSKAPRKKEGQEEKWRSCVVPLEENFSKFNSSAS